MTIIWRLSLLITCFMLVSCKRPPVVCLKRLGCVSGTYMPGFNSEYFEAFLGIPYARPPVNNRRFANPEPADPWPWTLNASEAKPDCIQKNYLLPTPIVTGSEDCLYLNIYRPRTTNTSRYLPVMVYIFGGGFFSGSANPLIHGPEYFMDTKEVILVTFAYRLGAFGFLSTGDDNSPGNFGLKDQSLALKWVHKYIRNFNGNPNSVTIFGQSAGGASVHMHMLSPLSRNLFNRGIVMSGNAGAPYNEFTKNPLNQARQQAKYVGISNASALSPKELIQALRRVDAVELLNAADRFKYWHVDPLVVFRPVVEQKRAGAFMIQRPAEIIESGNFTHVPWMTGFVPYESAVRVLSIISNKTLLNSFNENFDFLLEKLLEFPENSVPDKMNRLINYYFDGEHRLTPENADRFGKMITDRAFLHPLYKSISKYVSYANLEVNPVYLYKFNYRGPYSYSFLYTGGFNNYGVVHCDDLIYLFRSPLLFPQDFEKNSTDAEVVRTLVDTYVSFAKIGKPNGWDKTRPCDNSHIPGTHTPNQSETSFCDYQELKNSETNPRGFEINVSNDFDLDMIPFWNEVLGEV